MTTLVTALDTIFTPSVGVFSAQVTGGSAYLYRRQTDGAAWAIVGVLRTDLAVVVDNPVADADYKITTASGSPVVQADQ